ncbi:MAG TPA: DUF2937 family protein [Nevskiaceae bacterium]|nr:DUF2937 family protein [Nevskiaceae bacterium]
MSFVPRYLLMLAFGVALLAGVQVPNFVTQYTQRVDAHLKQVQQDLAGFQAVAQKFFHGDLMALVAAHDTSSDPAFRAEGVPLRQMVESERRLGAEHAGLSGSVYHQTLYLLGHADPALLKETWRGYAPAFSLSRDALVLGAGLAFGLCLLAELSALFLRASFNLMRPRRRQSA